MATGSIFKKLDRLGVTLTNWAKGIKSQRVGLKCELDEKLEALLNGDRNDTNLAEIIDTRIQLNLEIDKDETY